MTIMKPGDIVYGKHSKRVGLVKEVSIRGVIRGEFIDHRSRESFPSGFVAYPGVYKRIWSLN